MHTNHLDTTPFWLTGARTHHYAPLDRDLHVDAVVIGGGITGLTAAYLLKQAGKTVALIERRRIAESETGHTTAHLTAVTDHSLSHLVASLGDDHATATWDAGFAAIAQIQEIVLSEHIECDFSWVPGYLYASASQDKDEARAECGQEAEIATRLGFDATLVDEAPVFGGTGRALRGTSAISSGEIPWRPHRTHSGRRVLRLRRHRGGRGRRPSPENPMRPTHSAG